MLTESQSSLSNGTSKENYNLSDNISFSLFSDHSFNEFDFNSLADEIDASQKPTKKLPKRNSLSSLSGTNSKFISGNNSDESFNSLTKRSNKTKINSENSSSNLSELCRKRKASTDNNSQNEDVSKKKIIKRNSVDYQNFLKKPKNMKGKFLRYISVSDEDIKIVCEVDASIGYEFNSLVKGNCLVYLSWKKMCEELNSIGFYFLNGQFTFQELKILARNWKKLKKNIPFEDPLIVFDYQNENRILKHKIAVYLKENCLFQRLCKGIKRNMFAIYQRAKVFFLKKENDDKEWTQEDIEKLKELMAEYKNDWQKISERMGRNSQNCRDRAQHIITYDTSNFNTNVSWTAEEDQQLYKAVANYLKRVKNKDISHLVIDNYTKLVVNNQIYADESFILFAESIYRSYRGDDRLLSNSICDRFEESDYDPDLFVGLPWKEIAKDVPRRNRKQCRIRWLFKLVGHLYRLEPDFIFTRTDKLNLIKILLKMNLPSESYIDWTEIGRKFKKIPSPQFLRNTWSILRSMVPDFYIKSLNEILVELYFHLSGKKKKVPTATLR